MTKPDPEAGPAGPETRKGRRGRPPKSEGPSGTSELILDVAEDLFSKHGLHGVSIRDVANEAGVDTALLHYYFGTKLGLFDAVFKRRAEILNAERLASLDAYALKAGDALTPEGVISAFLQPLVEWGEKGGPGWKHYFALISQANANPVWGGETMTRYFDPVIHRLISVVKKALPKAREEDLFWSYHMLSGSLTLTLAETGRIDTLSGGICRSEDIAAVAPRMVAYASAGFRAVCED